MSSYRDDLRTHGGVEEAGRMGEISQDNELGLLMYGSGFEFNNETIDGLNLMRHQLS